MNGMRIRSNAIPHQGMSPDHVKGRHNLIGTSLEGVLPPVACRLAAAGLVERKRPDPSRKKGVLDRREIPAAGAVRRARSLEHDDDGMALSTIGQAQSSYEIETIPSEAKGALGHCSRLYRRNVVQVASNA
jgi:hypothetical protein